MVIPMNKISPEPTRLDKVTLKDVLDKLKHVTAKQRTAEQKAAKLSKELEEERKKVREERSCVICKDVILEMTKRSQKIVEDAQAIRDMFRTRTDRIKMKDGITYTIDDLSARMEINKCYVQKSLEKYNACCKEKKLPSQERFIC